MKWPRFALILAMIVAFLSAGSVAGQESTPTPASGDSERPAFTSESEATPAGEEEPQVDLLEFGAWGVASRDFEQSGEDLTFPLIYTASVAAFPDEETAEEAFPQVVDAMLDIEQNQQLDEVTIDPIADDQVFLLGQIESRGFTFNLGMLVVRNGVFLTLAGGFSVEMHDIQDDLIALSTLLQERVEGKTPETGDDLLALLPDPDELPGADEIEDPYVIRDERVRTAD